MALNTQTLIFSINVGTGLISLGVLAWTISQDRLRAARTAALSDELGRTQFGLEAMLASAEAFESCLLAIENGHVSLVSGQETFSTCQAILGLNKANAGAVLEALRQTSPDHARKLKGLIDQGEACSLEIKSPLGAIRVDGRTAGALAWLRISPLDHDAQGLPPPSQFAAFLDSRTSPAWMTAADGTPTWVNKAWLGAVGATSLREALDRGASLDPAIDALGRDSVSRKETRQLVRWISFGGRRRALRLTASPIDGGASIWSEDITEAEDLREALKRNVEAHDETLNHIADAVAVFTPTRRLSFFNTAFSELWGLEPAWLGERPTHSEVLDRLRQRRKLPETADYARWKGSELAAYQRLEGVPDDIWSLPDGRTLRVVRQPHPLGGIVLLFSDMTGELRLKAQYNALIQVQKATLDKLNDAVAVFGSDGRLRLHNEAFERFWGLTPQQLALAHDFEGVVDLCVPKVHDQTFWRDLKARVADTDPQARAPVTGEVRTSESRAVVYQSRPLPDGATLIAFTDVTDARKLESALADRSAALTEAERLKRDFVANVSYELRTPLTTILGYSELLGGVEDTLTAAGREHAEAIRLAAAQLARSIDDVLDMAEIDANEMTLEMGSVDVADLFKAADVRWQPLAQRDGIRLTVLCPAEIGMMPGDVRRLSQVVHHLAEHALRQTPRGGSVTLSARRGFGEIQIAVADTGRGIPFDVQAHIFDRFIGRDRGAPGLALSLVKSIVDLHGGWVTLESEPGAGSTFTCHLPETAEGQDAPA